MRITIQKKLTIVIAVTSTLVGSTFCFSVSSKGASRTTKSSDSAGVLLEDESSWSPDRRSLLRHTMSSAAAAAAMLVVCPNTATAAVTDTTTKASTLPVITTTEFESILKSSYRSVATVEFTGAKLDQATVRLVDGTTFGISDLIESSTDPRSPLRLMATLRGYNVPTSTKLEYDLLSSSRTVPKKTKVYSNARVQEAAVKEAAKRERMRVDELERQSELERRKEEAVVAVEATTASEAASSSE